MAVTFDAEVAAQFLRCGDIIERASEVFVVAAAPVRDRIGGYVHVRGASTGGLGRPGEVFLMTIPCDVMVPIASAC